MGEGVVISLVMVLVFVLIASRFAADAFIISRNISAYQHLR
jgi:hypothetical protein